MGKLVFREERCKGCGLCIIACPKKILAQASSVNDSGYYPVNCTDESQCISCAICARSCPDLVIEVYK